MTLRRVELQNMLTNEKTTKQGELEAWIPRLESSEPLTADEEVALNALLKSSTSISITAQPHRPSAAIPGKADMETRHFNSGL